MMRGVVRRSTSLLIPTWRGDAEGNVVRCPFQTGEVSVTALWEVTDLATRLQRDIVRMLVGDLQRRAAAHLSR